MHQPRNFALYAKSQTKLILFGTVQKTKTTVDKSLNIMQEPPTNLIPNSKFHSKLPLPSAPQWICSLVYSITLAKFPHMLNYSKSTPWYTTLLLQYSLVEYLRRPVQPCRELARLLPPPLPPWVGVGQGLVYADPICVAMELQVACDWRELQLLLAPWGMEEGPRRRLRGGGGRRPTGKIQSNNTEL